jgi:hypothetical protein
MGLLRSLFRGTRATKEIGVGEAERLEDLFEEFCRTFQHKPGENFVDHLRSTGADRMIAWLHPSTECALPKGFVRLAVDSTRKGYKVWELPGISMAYEGRWDHGGLPPEESLEALSVLAQIIEKPIKLYYTEKQGGDPMVLRFEP